MASRQSVQPRIVAHTIDLFQGGVDMGVSPYSIAEGQALYAENFEFQRDGTATVRQGYALGPNPVAKSGDFVSQRLQGAILNVYRSAATLYTQPAGGNGIPTNKGILPNEEHTFVRVTNGVYIVQPSGINLLDGDGLNTTDIGIPPTPGSNQLPGGGLKEGTYKYTYHYLLKGGFESVTSEFTEIVVPDDSIITVLFPAPLTHPKIVSIRLFRQGPTDSFPLRIADLPIGVTEFADTGVIQSPVLPMQGLKPMPGGNMALIQNRRLFVVDQDTLRYSYPGNVGYYNAFWEEKVTLPTGEPLRAMCPLGQGIIFFGLESALFLNAAPAEGGGFNPIPVPDGAVGKNAWALAEDGTLIYMGKGGVYAMQGAQAVRISDQITPIFKNKTIGELAQATMAYDQENRRLIISLTDQILVYYFQTRAWSIWTIAGSEISWFEGNVNLYKETGFGYLSYGDTDNGAAITAKFISGFHGLDDAVLHKHFRRVGIQLSAPEEDFARIDLRTGMTASDFNPDNFVYPNSSSTWGEALWGNGKWAGNIDTTFHLTLPDHMQGRYIQFTITVTSTNGGRATLFAPVMVEYRPRYRYGRG